MECENCKKLKREIEFREKVIKGFFKLTDNLKKIIKEHFKKEI